MGHLQLHYIPNDSSTIKVASVQVESSKTVTTSYGRIRTSLSRYLVSKYACMTIKLRVSMTVLPTKWPLYYQGYICLEIQNELQLMSFRPEHPLTYYGVLANTEYTTYRLIRKYGSTSYFRCWVEKFCAPAIYICCP